jgi:hypothetical protein
VFVCFVAWACRRRVVAGLYYAFLLLSADLTVKNELPGVYVELKDGIETARMEKQEQPL